MIEANKKRWFQWRLSTWFVLIGIAAWVMSTRPKHIRFDSKAHGGLPPGIPSDWIVNFEGWTPTNYYEVMVWLDPAIVWPTFALLAFIVWKLAWRIIEHRRARAAAAD